MRTENDLLEQLAQIAHHVSEAEGVDDLLQLIVDLGESYLQVLDGASLMLIGRDLAISTPVYSSRVAYEGELAQLQADEGPYLDALRNHAVYMIDDLEAAQRWPQYGAAALKLDVRSMLSYRFYAQGRTCGAIVFYSKRPDVCSPCSKAFGKVFTSHAGVGLRRAMSEAGMEEVIGSRDIIGQTRRRHGGSGPCLRTMA